MNDHSVPEQSKKADMGLPPMLISWNDSDDVH